MPNLKRRLRERRKVMIALDVPFSDETLIREFEAVSLIDLSMRDEIAEHSVVSVPGYEIGTGGRIIDHIRTEPKKIGVTLLLFDDLKTAPSGLAFNTKDQQFSFLTYLRILKAPFRFICELGEFEVLIESLTVNASLDSLTAWEAEMSLTEIVIVEATVTEFQVIVDKDGKVISITSPDSTFTQVTLDIPEVVGEPHLTDLEKLWDFLWP